jgi:hypothetical protein
MSTVTCHTENCSNNGIPIEMQLSFEVTDEWGDTSTVTVGGVACGVCGQPITDIDPPLQQT